MTPDQEVRAAALNAAIAWLNAAPDVTTPQMLGMADQFQEYILGTDLDVVRDANGRIVVNELHRGQR